MLILLEKCMQSALFIIIEEIILGSDAEVHDASRICLWKAKRYRI